MTDNHDHLYRAVCDRSLPIDANVLCNIVEQLCSAYCVAYRLQSWRTSLHDLTLARKWMERLCLDDSLRTQNMELLRLLVDQIPVILKELFAGSYGKLMFNVLSIKASLNIFLSQGFFYGNGTRTSDFRFDTFL